MSPDIYYPGARRCRSSAPACLGQSSPEQDQKGQRSSQHESLSPGGLGTPPRHQLDTEGNSASSTLQVPGQTLAPQTTWLL